MSLLGLDVGTSGCKALVVDEAGNVRGQAYREYAMLSPEPGLAELDPEQVWTAVKAVIRQVASDAGREVRAISVASFGEAFVALDGGGRVLSNSLLYIDPRGADEAERLSRSMDERAIHALTGTTAHAMYSLPKMMWYRNNRPQLHARAWKYLLFSGFVLFRLGAEPHTDHSLAARTLAFDVVGKTWAEALLGHADIDRGLLGDPVASGMPVGRLRPELATELGLPSGVLLVSGGHDQPCAALGAGAVRAGMAIDGLGTTECVTPVFDRPVINPLTAAGGYACVPHVLAERYVTYAFTFTCGSMLAWYLGRFGEGIRARADASGMNPYDALIAGASSEPAGMFVLPHFAGAATPYMDTGARGAMVGLTLDTSAGEIIRAILEGVTFEMMVNVERLSGAGIAVSELFATGGLARSEWFLQLKADMMDLPVTALRISEAGALGAAILAGAGSGVFRSPEEGAQALVRTGRTFLPRPDLARHYRERFGRYACIHDAIRGIG